ncbi:MSMB protein, partial [Cochlearius cochlearius]|nr:MSMB protein [Cochlearius cochlearius]
CRDSNGELHKFGSHWRNADCYDCYCSGLGMHCCSSFTIPVVYDGEKCVKILNKETCTFKAVKKDDHSKECPFAGSTD